MAIARTGLKVKVTCQGQGLGQANVVGPTSIEGSFFLVLAPALCVAALQILGGGSSAAGSSSSAAASWGLWSVDFGGLNSERRSC